MDYRERIEKIDDIRRELRRRKDLSERVNEGALRYESRRERGLSEDRRSRRELRERSELTEGMESEVDEYTTGRGWDALLDILVDVCESQMDFARTETGPADSRGRSRVDPEHQEYAKGLEKLLKDLRIAARTASSIWLP